MRQFCLPHLCCYIAVIQRNLRKFGLILFLVEVILCPHRPLIDKLI